MNASIFVNMDGYQVDGSSLDGELKLDLRRINFKIGAIGGMIPHLPGEGC